MRKVYYNSLLIFLVPLLSNAELVINEDLGILAQEEGLGGTLSAEGVNLVGDTSQGQDNAQTYDENFLAGRFVGNEWVYKFTLLEERDIRLVPQSLTESIYAVLLNDPRTEQISIEQPDGTIRNLKNATATVKAAFLEETNPSQQVFWSGVPPGTYYLSIESFAEAPATFDILMAVTEPFEGLSPDNPIPLGILGNNSTTIAFDTFGSAVADTEIAVYSVTPAVIGTNVSILELPPYPGSEEPFAVNDDFSEADLNLQSALVFTPPDGKYLVALGVYDSEFYQDGRYNKGPGGLGIGGSFLTLNFSKMSESVGEPRFAPIVNNLFDSKDPIVQQTDSEGLVWFSFEIKTANASVINFEINQEVTTLSWSSLLGCNYQVQRSIDLRRWQDIGEVFAGTGGPMSYSKSISSEPTSFLASDQIDPLSLRSQEVNGNESVKTADLDGDGDLDFVIMTLVPYILGQEPTYRVKWLRNNGDETWSSLPISGGNIRENNGCCIHLVDIDNDSDIDIVSGARGRFENGIGASLRVYHNDGQASFTVTNVLTTSFFNQSFDAAKHLTGITTADMDGDLDLDIVMIQGNSVDRVSWIPNNGGGKYGSTTIIKKETDGGRDPISIDTGDIDKDGDVDLAVSYDEGENNGMTGQILFFENPGISGVWKSHIVATDHLASAQDICLVDLNNDGALDIVSSSRRSGQITSHLGDGRGSFNLQKSIAETNTEARGLHVVDFDMDGDLDIFTVSPVENRISFYESLSGTEFNPPSVFSSNTNGATGLFTTDINGDGKLNVIAHGRRIDWYEKFKKKEFFRIIVPSTENPFN